MTAEIHRECYTFAFYDDGITVITYPCGHLDRFDNGPNQAFNLASAREDYVVDFLETMHQLENGDDDDVYSLS